jgi:hypothetical protein
MFIVVVLFSGCATIIGGSKYNAHIVVTDKPNAKIVYEGKLQGTGSATIQVFRSQANNFSFAVMEDGCNEQKYEYKSRTFRGWALIGTIVGWTGILNGIPLPWGVVVDIATGALWKPDITEKGISKVDFKTFNYQVDYPSCSPVKIETYQYPLDVVYLKNGKIVKGVIIEQVPDVHIKIQTPDGSIFLYNAAVVEKITRQLSE